MQIIIIEKEKKNSINQEKINFFFTDKNNDVD